MEEYENQSFEELRSEAYSYLLSHGEFDSKTSLVIDTRLTMFLTVFKIHPCIYLLNGCQNECHPKGQYQNI